jgi:hypothetical protein
MCNLDSCSISHLTEPLQALFAPQGNACPKPAPAALGQTEENGCAIQDPADYIGFRPSGRRLTACSAARNRFSNAAAVVRMPRACSHLRPYSRIAARVVVPPPSAARALMQSKSASVAFRSAASGRVLNLSSATEPQQAPRQPISRIRRTDRLSPSTSQSSQASAVLVRAGRRRNTVSGPPLL